jgi:hypothetical protein
MWSRVVEIMLGCWLLISPFVFGHPDDRIGWWITDFSAGLAVIVFGCLSYWRPARFAHLLTAVTGALLIAAAYRFYGDAPPAAQNEALTGLLLMMFAVIPNEAASPPQAWRDAMRELRDDPVGRDPAASRRTASRSQAV